MKFFIVLILSLSLLGCGGSGSDSNQGSTPSNPGTGAGSSSGITPSEPTIVRVNNVEFELVDIPAGSFVMGADHSDSRITGQPAHQVGVDAFKMMTTEVTQDQWQAIMGNNPSEFQECGGDCPVDSVSWNDVQAFITELNRLAGLNGEAFQLPSDAQWEYTIGRGLDTNFSWGNELGINNANCSDCGSKGSNRRTLPVKSFAPNPSGIYDMHGNLWEWLQDCYNANYYGAPIDGSAWLEGDCDKAVVRGGAWYSYGSRMGVKARSNSDKTFKLNYIGFRLVVQ